ncbi:MAG: YfhH family protein [Bacillaceae bacterium]|nr:YfhH family protein [Bacillaceae bacterium]
MEKRYSEMTTYELNQEIGMLKEKARKAEQLGIVNEYAVLERKITMAQSYLMNAEDYSKGEVYEIEGDPGVHFIITYMNGIFAWGHRIHNGVESKEEEGLPIAMLRTRVE